MTAMDALVLRSQNQTIVITRSLVPARAAQMRQTSGGELRGALDVHLSGDSVDAQLLSTFWLAAGGPVLSVLRPAELVAAVVAAVEAGRLRAYVFKEPAYISQASHQALRGDAERAVRGPLRSGTPAVGRQLTVAQMGAAERFVEVFHRTVPRVGPELGRQLRAIVENPTDLAFMVGTVVILVQLHAVAAGEVIDGIVLTAIIACAVIEGMGVFQATLAALEAAANLVDFLTTTLAARDEKDLDRAAEKLAAGLSAVGVGILSAALARIAGRFTDSLKKAGGQRKVETVSKEEMAGKGRGSREAASTPRPSSKDSRVKDPKPAGTATGGGENGLTAASSLSSGLGELKSTHSGIVSIGEPGPLPSDLAATFSGGRYDVVRLKTDIILYRAGIAGEPLGQFFSPTMPRGIIQTRIDQAVRPIWRDGSKSPLDTGFAVRIPAGTDIYVGKIGTQGGPFSGGADQILVMKPREIEGVKVMASWSLK